MLLESFQFFKEYILTDCHQKTQTEVITLAYHSIVKNNQLHTVLQKKWLVKFSDTATKQSKAIGIKCTPILD